MTGFSLTDFLAATTLVGTLLAPLNSLAVGPDGRPADDDEQIRRASPNPPPDERFKTDILVIVAHPDDETEITGYLARAIFDEHKRVAAIFGTPGNGGGDAVSNAQAAALGDIRMTEAREALAFFGVLHVWFLGGSDTPGQDVLRSLETWNHGNALWETIRLVRLTRPEVIMTWLPDYVAGENHGDHQASAVIATEAFDLAGDPTVFPEQISAPRDRTSIANLTEGLEPWQPKKIYYFSDAINADFLKGQGPQYSTTDISPSKNETYYKLAAEQMSRHLTQGDSGQMAKQALETGDFTYFKQPVLLALGKSLVPCATTGDVFEGITPRAIPYAPVRGYRPQERSGISVELGGPWAFYGDFWKAHNLDALSGLIKTPEVALANAAPLHVPILIRNDTDTPAEVTLTSSVPPGWQEVNGTARYPVRPHEAYPAQTLYVAPSTSQPEWQTLSWKAEANGKTIGTITLRVRTDSPGLPQ
jgi:LmbE family N-acetylglucosaminyl deacetylase